MSCFFPNGDRRRGEMGVAEVADRHCDVSGKIFTLPINGGAASRTEVKGQQVAAFGYPPPRRSLSSDGDLFAAEARLVADHGTSAALALQTVAQGDTRWFALNRKVKLPAAAGGASGPAPWLSLWRSVGWTSNRCTATRRATAQYVAAGNGPIGRVAGVAQW
jgi:hypothetical protein